MGFLNKMERKFGKYAIPNLTIFIIVAYIIGYLLLLLARDTLSFFYLDPAKIIFEFQIWRIVSWIFVPPQGLSIFTIIMLLFYYSIGTNLERTWGTFRYNCYIFSGILFTIVGAFVLFVINYIVYGELGAHFLSEIYSPLFSTYYISLSMFLGYALTYPEMKVWLYMIIPIKIKYLAILDLVILAYDMITGAWGVRVVIISSLLNVIIFFFATRNYKRVSPKEIHRKQVYRRETQRPAGVTKHKCAICGRTEKDGDNLEFRFCSKCDGNYEYCQDHLFTHEHKKNI